VTSVETLSGAQVPDVIVSVMVFVPAVVHV
jgi:hypothetical protein